MNMMAQWEDEANNRQVQFSVEYSIENATVTIDQITPTKVTFIDAESNSAVKNIGVHTAKGRQLLSDQFIASGQLEELSLEIGRRNGLLVSV